MSEMVERVARAIGCTSFDRCDQYSVAECKHCKEGARRAIEAMREPTEGMVNAVDIDVTGQTYLIEGQAKAAYQAMIDEALK